MGYYSTLKPFEGKVKKYNKEALENLNQKLEQGEFQGFEGGKIIISEEGYVDIELAEYYCKFYGDEEFANELSKVIEEGYIIMKFIGEDADEWGYRITPNNVEPLHFIEAGSSQHSRLNLIDTTDFGISSVKCPACFYEASFFMTSEPIDEKTIKAIEENNLEELENPPICNNCWMETVKENKYQVLEITTVEKGE